MSVVRPKMRILDTEFHIISSRSCDDAPKHITQANGFAKQLLSFESITIKSNLLFICPRIPHTPSISVSVSVFPFPTRTPNLILFRSMKPFRESFSCSSRFSFNIAVLSSIFHRRSLPPLTLFHSSRFVGSRGESNKRASASISPPLIFNPLKEKITIKIQILTISAPLFDAMQRCCFPLSAEYTLHCTSKRLLCEKDTRSET